MGLRIETSTKERSGGHLDLDINDGFNSSTFIYIIPTWTNDVDEAASKIELIIDEDCKNKNQSNDITQNALFHCDCRYLSIDGEKQNKTPIVNVWYSNQTNLNETCTPNINDGRKPTQDSSLYLCWDYEQGTFMLCYCY